jgi:hypothetical protein
MPYFIARTAEVERALFLRQWGVPFWALAEVFGRDAMLWYRTWHGYQGVTQGQVSPLLSALGKEARPLLCHA